jgi:hypothetical protein
MTAYNVPQVFFLSVAHLLHAGMPARQTDLAFRLPFLERSRFGAPFSERLYVDLSARARMSRDQLKQLCLMTIRGP